MKAMRLVVLMAVGLLASGCAVGTAGSPSAGTVESASPGVMTDADPDPCGLLSSDQRRSLGVGDGEEATEIPLEGARFCSWDSASGGLDMFQGGVLPSAYRLSDVKRNYPGHQDALIGGLPGVSTSSRDDIADRSCLLFAELPDSRLSTVSYFWNGGPTGSTHEMSCRKATAALEMVVATAQTR